MKPPRKIKDILLLLLSIVFAAGVTSAQDAAKSIEFVRIEPGEFMMGCSVETKPTTSQEQAYRDNGCIVMERPTHRVLLTKPFEIGKYEVTQAQWESVMGLNPSYFKGPDRPVEQVSWNDIQQFLQKLNTRNDGYRYRLPTEAEWEYAARAGTTGIFPAPLDHIAWYDQNSEQQTHPVGQKQPNAWGLYDMLGNVREWVQDWHSLRYYQVSPDTDPTGPASGGSGGSKVLRGGSWSAVEHSLRTSSKFDLQPSVRLNDLGFRVVRESIR